jgi:hypothetical protein
MFCPQCGAEYREGFDRCSDCDVALIEEGPREAQVDFVDFVTVLETGDRSLLLVAKSVLESAGIRFCARGEGVQDLFALGRMGTGFNPLTGPVRLEVEPERADEARALLEKTESGPADET